jgi:hypothetical protein
MRIEFNEVTKGQRIFLINDSVLCIYWIINKTAETVDILKFCASKKYDSYFLKREIYSKSYWNDKVNFSEDLSRDSQLNRKEAFRRLLE